MALLGEQLREEVLERRRIHVPEHRIVQLTCRMASQLFTLPQLDSEPEVYRVPTARFLLASVAPHQGLNQWMRILRRDVNNVYIDFPT